MKSSSLWLGAIVFWVVVLAFLVWHMVSKETPPAARARDAVATDSRGALLYRFEPDEFGVACYRYQAGGFSCVKVR